MKMRLQEVTDTSSAQIIGRDNNGSPRQSRSISGQRVTFTTDEEINFGQSIQTLIDQAVALIEQRRFAAADNLLEHALSIDPSSLSASFQYARSAARSGDWQEVLKRWNQAGQYLRSCIDVPIGLAEALRELGRLEEALETIKDALVRFACDPRLLPALARIAQAQKNFRGAADCWNRYVTWAPNDHWGYVGLGTALLEDGRHSDAVQALHRSQQIAPDDAWAATLLARALTFNGNLDQAFEVWHKLKREHPTNEAIQRSFRETIFALRLSVADAGLATEPLTAMKLLPTPPQLVKWEKELEDGWTELSFRHLMLNFESLGGSCEFGLVQRHYGAEPLGLLRWASIPLHCLIEALNNKFDGIGNLDQTKLDVYEGNEYALIDERYKMRSHTRIMVGQADKDEILQQQSKRLQYLRNKLVSDLESAEKILVFSIRERLTDSQIDHLFSAVGRYGPNDLLCIRPEDEDHPNTTVESPKSGLFIGYMDDPWRGGTAPVSVEAWLAICRQVSTRRRAVMGAVP